MTTQKWYVADEEKAIRHAKLYSQKSELWVVVEGPADEEFTAMPIKDAISNGFLYSWYR